jgi:hypothetical protein
MKAVVPFLVVAALAVLIVWQAASARRAGYRLGGNVIVRCREGHLFTTIWIPLASFKAIRLGMIRIQRCPVDGRITLVTPVRDEDLTEEERLEAARHHDVPVP